MSSPPPPRPPSPAALITVYVILGSVMSFLCGHAPGSLPENLVAELCPSIIVVSGFLISYSVFDVMACGQAKAEAGFFDKKYNDFPSRVPEAVFLAERAQMNQIEQLPSLLVSSLCFSLLVNGKVGALFSLLWAVLRRLYASRYRNSVGVPLNKKGLAVYTVPCYFLVNTMLMGSAVQALRWVVVSNQ